MPQTLVNVRVYAPNMYNRSQCESLLLQACSICLEQQICCISSRLLDSNGLHSYIQYKIKWEITSTLCRYSITFLNCILFIFQQFNNYNYNVIIDLVVPARATLGIRTHSKQQLLLVVHRLTHSGIYPVCELIW